MQSAIPIMAGLIHLTALQAPETPYQRSSETFTWDGRDSAMLQLLRRSNRHVSLGSCACCCIVSSRSFLCISMPWRAPHLCIALLAKCCLTSRTLCHMEATEVEFDSVAPYDMPQILQHDQCRRSSPLYPHT